MHNYRRNFDLARKLRKRPSVALQLSERNRSNLRSRRDHPREQPWHPAKNLEHQWHAESHTKPDAACQATPNRSRVEVRTEGINA